MKKKDKLIINAASVNGGGAKKRLLKTVSLLSNNYDLLVIKRKAVILECDSVKCINFSGRLIGLLRIISDFILPLILFIFGYKKMYVFGNFFIGFYPGKLVWNLTNVEPFLVEKNNSYSFFYKFRLYVLKFLFYFSKKPDFLILQSNFTKEVILKNINLDSNKLVYVYNAVDIPYREKEQGLNTNVSNKILFVGQLVRYKRLELIILQLFKNNVFNDYELHIAGQLDWDIDYVSELKALVKELNIEKNVYFLGELPPCEIVELYSGSRFLVYASLYDNCPNNILEAFSLGLPVLAWNNGVINELSQFGKVVLVNDNLEDIHLKDILNMNPVTGRVYDFSWEAHCKKISSIIDKT